MSLALGLLVLAACASTPPPSVVPDDDAGLQAPAPDGPAGVPYGDADTPADGDDPVSDPQPDADPVPNPQPDPDPVPDPDPQPDADPQPDPQPDPDPGVEPEPEPDPDPGPDPGPDPDPAPAPISGPVAVLYDLVNAARAEQRSCGTEGVFAAAAPLTLDARLMAAAQKHSADMHQHGFMSHIGSDGSTLRQRVEREGYAWRRLSENVAWGYAMPEGVMAAWLGSDGHCANIMDPQVSELGLGLEGVRWTQVFAKPW